MLRIEIDYEIKTMNKTKKICKSCLTEDFEMINILLACDEEHKIKFCEEYLLCTGIATQLYDGLPNSICQKCLIELNIAYNFRIRSQKSDEFLRQKCTKVSKPLDATVLPREVSQNRDMFVDDLVESKLKFRLTKTNQLVSEKRKSNSFESINGEEYNLQNEEEYEILNENETEYNSPLNEEFLISDLEGNEERKPLQCDQCDKSYFSRNGLSSHRQTHKPDYKPPPAEFLCATCGKGFKTATKLREHSYVHTGERRFPCDLCNKAFQTGFRLRSHRRIHTGEKPYKCQVCGLRFAQRNALLCHKRIHTGEKPYECKICFKRFSQLGILHTHMALHTGKTVECPDCDKMFCRPSQLITHRREHTGEKPYVCTICPNRYRQKNHLDRHMDLHNGIKYNCVICQRPFTRKYALKSHMYTHTNERPYKCSECPKSFIRKDKHTAHTKQCHPVGNDQF